MSDYFDRLVAPKKVQQKGYSDRLLDRDYPQRLAERRLPKYGARESVLQGATLGFADEIGAAGTATGDAIANLLAGKTANWKTAFDEALADYAEAERRYKQSHPNRAFWSEVYGSLTVPGAMVGKAISSAKSLPGAMGRGAATGAGLGAASGAGHASSGERLPGAAIGAGTGAVVGAAIPGVVAGGQKAVEVATRAIPGSAKRESGVKLAQALQRDDITPDQAMSRVRQVGPQGVIADIGENARALAGGVTRTPSAARSKAVTFLERRQRYQHRRIAQATREALGAQGAYNRQVTDLMDARATASKAAYDKAFANDWLQEGAGGSRVEDLLPLLKSDPVKSAWAKAQRMAESERVAGVLPADYRMPKSLEGDVLPDTRAVDYVKQALDDKVSALFRAGKGREANAIKAVRDRLKDIADDLNPDYAAARRIYAGPSQSLEMLERGKSFAKGDADFTQAQISEMSPADRAFFREGVSKAVSDVLAGKREGADKVAIMLRVPGMRDKLAATFESPAKFMGWVRKMLGEEKMVKTYQQLRGSPTAERLETSADLQQASRPSLLYDVMQAAQGSPFARIRLTNRASGAIRGNPREAVANELRNMFSTETAKQLELLSRARRAGPVAGLMRGLPGLVGAGAASQAHRPGMQGAVASPYLAYELIRDSTAAMPEVPR